MRRPLLQPIPSEFPYIWGKFCFLFYQCDIPSADHPSLKEHVNYQSLNTTCHSVQQCCGYKKYLKHLMAVMLETTEPKKAAVVVSEVTSMEREAWRRVWLTRLTSSGSSDSALWYNNSYSGCGLPGSPAQAHLTQPYETTIVTQGVAYQAHQLWLIWLSLIKQQ